MEDYLVAAFQKAVDATLAYKMLLSRNIEAAMMPVPRSISASCGLAVRFRPQDAEAAYTVFLDLFSEAASCRVFRPCAIQSRREFCPVEFRNEGKKASG